jgi:hypothetical protein
LVQKKTLYAITLAVAVIAVLALSTLSFQPSNVLTSSDTPPFSSPDNPSFRVLKINEVIPYDAGCIVLEGIGHSCPTKGANTVASSLREVELIAYGSTDYYAGNFSVGPFSAPSVTYLEVWFTNSTIFCVSPLYASFPACPLNESLPSVSW